MDFGFFGVVDIVVVLILLIALILGVTSGIFKTLGSLIKKVGGFFAAVMFSPSLGRFINDKFLSTGAIHDFFYGNINSKLEGHLANDATIDAAIDLLGFPTFIDNYIKSGIQNYDVATITEAITSRFTYAVGVVFAFIFLLIGVSILCFIFIKLGKVLEETSIIIKTISKVTGGILGFCIGLILIYVLLLILTQVAKIDSLESLREFLNVDMCLLTDEFRLSKYINNNNFIRGIFAILFGI